MNSDSNYTTAVSRSFRSSWKRLKIPFSSHFSIDVIFSTVFSMLFSENGSFIFIHWTGSHNYEDSIQRKKCHQVSNVESIHLEYLQYTSFKHTSACMSGYEKKIAHFTIHLIRVYKWSTSKAKHIHILMNQWPSIKDNIQIHKQTRMLVRLKVWICQ